MSEQWIDRYNALMAVRKPWVSNNHWGNYWKSLLLRVGLAARQSKLKPGKKWPRTTVYFVHSIIRDAEPNRWPRDRSFTSEIMAYHKHINARKRWKRITPHTGYLFWERMK